MATHLPLQHQKKNEVGRDNGDTETNNDRIRHAHIEGRDQGNILMKIKLKRQ